MGTILSEERDKQPCSKFLNGKHCIFGLNCRFSHKTPSQLQYLEDLYRLGNNSNIIKELFNLIQLFNYLLLIQRMS